MTQTHRTLTQLLTELDQQGVSVWAEADQLRIRAKKGVLTPELQAVLTEWKPQLLALLQQNVLGTAALPVIVPAPSDRHQPFPLTDMQYAFWVGRHGILELGTVANHGYYEIEGQHLDLERLNATLQTLIERHDMLRAIMLPDGQQQILAEVPSDQMTVLDLSGQDHTTVTATLEAIRAELSHQVMPSDRYPLFEFRVTLWDGDRMRLHVSYDLQIFDAWSLFRLFDEWFQLYQNPDHRLPALDISFRDYVLAEQALQETELYARSQQYWFNRLETLPTAPDLPLIQAPSALKQHHCKRWSGQLEPALWQQLQQRASQAGLTPTGVLLAAFTEVLSTWSNPRFTLNLALFNRLPLHPQVHDILGDFTSTTLLAVDHSVADSFTDRAVRLQQQLWRDLEHRYVSGVRVMRELARREGRAPTAMPVVFTSTLGFGTLGQEASALSHFGELVYGISQASQVWLDHQVFEQHGILKFNWDGVEDLFPPGLMDDMFEAYCQLLDRLATRDRPWQELPNLLPAAQQTQRTAINAPAAPVPEVLLHQLIAEQVKHQGHAPAVISPHLTLSYQELWDRAHQVAHRLRHLGVAANTLVAVVMEKGWEQVVAVLGIVIAGSAYVPIAPDLPQARVEYLLQNSGAQIGLTQSWLYESWVQQSWCEIDRGQWLCVDQEVAQENPQPLVPIQTLDDLAYVIYTSGSTGLPKGVMITHRNVVNVVITTNQRFQVSSGDRILALTALNHDLSVYDLFGVLSAGAAIVMPLAAQVKDPGHWADLIRQHRVTLWNSVPAMMEMLVNTLEEQPEALPESLRLAILGGDWLPVTLPQRLRSLLPPIQILSIGGPTETTIWNIGYLIDQVDPQWKSIPYGLPMTNSQYYILNETLTDCPIWVAGEMYCAGVQLAKGYWHDPEKTQAQFITHPRTGDRLYRTGDLGRYLPDGNIEFLGRADFQIKIRGYRIEAGEIESVLMQHPHIHAAIVIAVGDEPSQQRLVAYLIAEGVAPAIAELSEFLNPKLPDYMIPSGFIFLDTFPLSANGKVDRQALSSSADHFQSFTTIYVAPETDLEQTITTVWQDVLNLEKVGVNDNFFDIGGNSLLITTVYSSLKKILPEISESLSIVELFKYPTLHALANRLSQSKQPGLQPQNAKQFEQLQKGRQRLKQRFDLKASLRN